MKMTFYGQFVAGEDQRAIRPLILKNQAYGVGSILDYSVEEDIGQKQTDPEETSKYGSHTAVQRVLQSLLSTSGGSN